MKKYEICANKSDRILKIIAYSLPQYSYAQIERCLRNKDIKLNGVKIKSNVVVNENDVIQIYLNENLEKSKYQLFYEDKNIIILNKQSGIEVCDGDYNIQNDYEAKNQVKIYPVHRLDRNTIGLVVFAKSVSVLNELKEAFKNHNVTKYYFAVVYGDIKCDKKVLKSYLSKDAKNSKVQIFDKQIQHSVEIETQYEVIAKNDELSLLKVKIEAGKTHQIRAHLAHYNIYIVGDEKYGSFVINKKYKKKTQMLQAYKIIFGLNNKSTLRYLNDNVFCMQCAYTDWFKLKDDKII